MTPIDRSHIEPPSVLVRHTTAELRALRDFMVHPMESAEPRERDAIEVALDVDIPDLVDVWVPVGIRWEGADAFLARLAVGHADQVLYRILPRYETTLVRPEIWRNDPPWFTELRCTAIQRIQRTREHGPCYPGPAKTSYLDNLVVLIVVPAAAAGDDVFAMRIAYQTIESFGDGRCPRMFR